MQRDLHKWSMNIHLFEFSIDVFVLGQFLFGQILLLEEIARCRVNRPDLLQVHFFHLLQLFLSVRDVFVEETGEDDQPEEEE